jgi:hypothetical protein
MRQNKELEHVFDSNKNKRALGSDLINRHEGGWIKIIEEQEQARRKSPDFQEFATNASLIFIQSKGQDFVWKLGRQKSQPYRRMLFAFFLPFS